MRGALEEGQRTLEKARALVGEGGGKRTHEGIPEGALQGSGTTWAGLGFGFGFGFRLGLELGLGLGFGLAITSSAGDRESSQACSHGVGCAGGRTWDGKEFG